jgi:hypothetical protein
MYMNGFVFFIAVKEKKKNRTPSFVNISGIFLLVINDNIIMWPGLGIVNSFSEEAGKIGAEMARVNICY